MKRPAPKGPASRVNHHQSDTVGGYDANELRFWRAFGFEDQRDAQRVTAGMTRQVRRQAERLARKVRRRALAAGRLEGVTLGWGELNSPVIVHVLEHWAAAGRRWCPHLGPDRPQPTFLAGWERRLSCSACMAASMALLEGSPEDHRCDRCGEVGELVIGIAQVGLIHIAFGMCRGCAAELKVA